MTQEQMPVRVPEYEAAVLGACLLNQSVVDEVLNIIEHADAFSEKEHRVVFNAIKDLHTQGRPVDSVTVFELVSDDVSWTNYAGLTSAVPTSANADVYAQRVWEAYLIGQAYQAALRIQARCCESEANVGNVLDSAEAAFLQITEKRFHEDGALLADVVPHVREHLLALAKRQVGAGITTGLRRLDSFLNGGWQYGSLNVVAARPSVGKTALALQFAYAAAVQGIPVLFFSLEMSKEELSQRLLSLAGGVDVGALRQGIVQTGDLDNLDRTSHRISKLPLTVEDGASLTPQKLRGSARLHNRRHGKGLVIVDYLQLIGGNTARRERYQELGEISRTLKMTARELKCPILACAQLSRGAENETSGYRMLAMLRESGSIEQDSDAVVILRRYSEKEKADVMDSCNLGGGHDLIELTLAKHRNGPTGQIPMSFNWKRQHFAPLTREQQPPERHEDDEEDQPLF